MRLLRSEQGSALLEFSLILPIIVFMYLGMINLGVAVEQSIVVSEAAEAGTRYGMLPSKSTDFKGMQDAAIAAAGMQHAELDAAGKTTFSAVATPRCSCVPAGIAVNCSSTCPGSSALYKYIQVQTSATIPALANYPGLAASFALKGFSAMQVQ